MNIESIRSFSRDFAFGLYMFLTGQWLLSFVKWTCVGFFVYTFMFGPFPDDVYALICAVLMVGVKEEYDDAEDEEA